MIGAHRSIQRTRSYRADQGISTVSTPDANGGVLDQRPSESRRVHHQPGPTPTTLTLSLR